MLRLKHYGDFQSRSNCIAHCDRASCLWVSEIGMWWFCETVPHRLMGLTTWSPLSRPLWGGLASVALVEEVCVSPVAGLWVSRLEPFPLHFSALCLHINSSLCCPSQHAFALLAWTLSLRDWKGNGAPSLISCLGHRVLSW